MHYRLGLMCIVLVTVSSMGWASTISNSFQDAPSYENYRYRVFALGEVDDGAIIAMRSPDFDSYLMVLAPSGEFITNDDHSLDIEKQGNDAGFRIQEGSDGDWYVVATSFSPGSVGEFEIFYEGIADIQNLDTSAVPKDLIEEAFLKRGVENSDFARQRNLSDLVEQLSLPSFRRTLRDQLNESLSDSEREMASSRQSLADAEERLSEIEFAIAGVVDLEQFDGVIKQLAEDEFDRAKSQVEQRVSRATRLMSQKSAYEFAIAELDALEVVYNELERYEAALIETGLSNEDIEELQKSIKSKETELVALATELAERLIDSQIVRRIRFGGFIQEQPVHSLASGLTASAIGAVANFASMPRRLIGGGVSRSPSSLGERIDTAPWLPQIFPWPPPDASARSILDRRLLIDFAPETLGDIADLITNALAVAGYGGSGYLGVPGGFAIVTRIEQTDSLGAPLNEEARWLTQNRFLKSFSIEAYIRALLLAEPGYFRVIVLIVSNEPFSYSGARGRFETLERWSGQGVNTLPVSVRTLPYTDNHEVTALVYEFEKESKSENPEVRLPGRLTAQRHLAHTSFHSYLR